MTNDRYLIVSYIVVAAISLVCGLVVFVSLKRTFEDSLKYFAGRKLGSLLKRLFPVGIIVPALLGFVSVAYEDCEIRTYEGVVRDRGYLIQKNHEQLSSVCLMLLIAVIFWDVLIIVVQKYGRGRTAP
jgi:hypothetical protein